MSNVDINVDRRTDGRTDGRKIGRLYRTLLQAGAIKMLNYNTPSLSCNGQIPLSTIDENPKPDLLNFNACTKFG